MKPRIFISSTFYDLKYVREDLSNFVKSHDFEPIMFEDGDIGYTPGKNLDASCYEAMKSSDMVILIIGGNYGSPASGEKENFSEYISVTRNEFKTAIDYAIPIYAFIDSKVSVEYDIYEVNNIAIEEEHLPLKFKATKNVNIFRFIKEIKNMRSISIIEFNKTSDIKEFLSKQWADMFKNYLKSLKEDKEITQIKDAMEGMQSLIEQMGIMVNGVAKKLFNNDENDIDYKKAIEEQENIKIKNIAIKLTKLMKIEYDRSKIKKRGAVVRCLLTGLQKMYEEMSKFSPEDVYEVDNANIYTQFLVDELESLDMHIVDLDFNINYIKDEIYDIITDEEKTKLLMGFLCDGSMFFRIFRNRLAKSMMDIPSNAIY